MSNHREAWSAHIAKRFAGEAPSNAKARMQALGRLKAGKMNKSEAAYASHLQRLLECEEIVYYQFEAVKFRLAGNTFFSPDFLVISKGLAVELHEFKGFWTDDARVKIKVAADRYPYFRFIAVKKDKIGYRYEDF